MPAMAKTPMFFRQIIEVFLERTGAGFEHGEPGCHPHHQHTPDEEDESVEDELA